MGTIILVRSTAPVHAAPPALAMLARGNAVPRESRAAAVTPPGLPRTHTVPDLATDRLLKIAGSWEAGEQRLLRRGAGRERSSRGLAAGWGGPLWDWGHWGWGARGCGSRGWGAEGWVDSGLLQGLQLAAWRDPVRVRIWVGCGVPSGLRGTRRLSGIAGLCGAAPSCPTPRASVWPPAGKTG